MLLTLLCPTLLLHYFILQNCLNYFICHAFSVEIASEMVIDQYNHIIQQGEKYIACKNLEKLKETCGHIYIYIYIYILMVLTGKFCSLNQFFRGHFACGDKNMSPKSMFLNFTSYGDNLLAVIVYHVVLSADD